MAYALPHGRALAIANLQFNDKLKIAFQLTKARWLPYTLALFLITLGIGFAQGLNILLMFILIGFLTMIPLCFIIIFVIIGFNASILRHMDGIEPAISINTFFEPCKRWISLALPIFVVYLVLWIVSFIFQIFSIIPYLGLLIYPIASIFLTMLQTAYIMYWADNREGTIEEHLARPFKLLFRHVMCWVSAMLTGLLGYIPLILLPIVYIVIILMFFPDVELDEPDTFKTGASIAFSVVMFSIMFFALMAGFIVSAFLYAIAYKQSHAREQLMRPCFTPPQYPHRHKGQVYD